MAESINNKDIIVPFLKWAGGKRWLVEHPKFSIPTFTGRYIEPFLGSASVFFALAPANAILSDANSDLVETYNAIKNTPELVFSHLKIHARNHSKSYYYWVRDSHKPRTNYSRAAKFIYLNRTCWNGLYRVNLRGEFNVPKGTKKNVLLADDDFGETSSILRKATIVCSDFEKVIDKAEEGDFIYADPPYTVHHNMNGFIKYNENLFEWQDQVRLRTALFRAKNRGVHVLVSNANHPSITKLYSDAKSKAYLQRTSVISGSNEGRGKMTELLICL